MNIIQKILYPLFKAKVNFETERNKEREISKQKLIDHVSSVVEEYNLIQQGISKLSRRKRDDVIAYMEKLEELDYVKINRHE